MMSFAPCEATGDAIAHKLLWMSVSVPTMKGSGHTRIENCA